MDITKLYADVDLETNTLTLGKRTQIKLLNLDGLKYSIVKSNMCDAKDLKRGNLEIRVCKGTNPYIHPSVTVAVYRPGWTAVERTFTFNIQHTFESALGFELHAGLFKPRKDIRVLITGPVGYSYRLLTNKVGEGVLDYQYIRPNPEWVAVNESMDIHVRLCNGVTNPKLRFEFREDCNPRVPIVMLKTVTSVIDDRHHRIFTNRESACTLMKVGELLIKGADPIATTNPYVSQIIIQDDVFSTPHHLRKEDNNVSSVHNSLGRTLAVQLVYDTTPYIKIINTMDRVDVAMGKTVWKNGKIMSGYKGSIPFEPEEGTVVMIFDRLGDITGPVWVTLRRPEEEVVWRKGEDTQVRVIGGPNLSISGGTLPSNIPNIYKDFVMGSSVIIDHIPVTGFVQTT